MLWKSALPMRWNYLFNSSRVVSRISLLAGYLAGEMCSVYSTFVAHTMSPVSYRLVESDRKLRAIYGAYRETYNMGGLVFTLAISVLVFAIAWCVVRAIAEVIAMPEATFLPASAFSSSGESKTNPV